VALELDETFEQKVSERVQTLQQAREAELRNLGREELADEVADSEPSMATYLKALVRKDLESAGLVG
jgi:hypothetical protein